MPLAKLLADERILDLPGGERESVLSALCEAVSGDGLAREALLSAVLEREALCSTGFGAGLAMPHVRLAEVSSFRIALARAREGIPFDAVDGEPVRLLLLVVGPLRERERYQRLMAKAARFLKDAGPHLLAAEDLRAAVRSALVG